MALGRGALADEEMVVTLEDTGDHSNRELGQEGSDKLGDGDCSAPSV